MPETLNQQKIMNLSERQEKIESMIICLKDKKIDKNSLYPLASHLLSDVNTSEEADDLIKKFKDTTSVIASKIGVTEADHVGTTSENALPNTTSDNSKEPVDTTHTHTFAVMILNYYEILVGITTSTTGTDNHVHTIKIALDPKTIAIEAYTNYAYILPTNGMPGNDYHNHEIAVEVESLAETTPSLYIPTSNCYTDKNVSAFKLSENINKTMSRRQAEITLLKLSQTGDEKITDDMKASAFNSISKQYSDLSVFDNSFVAEI